MGEVEDQLKSSKDWPIEVFISYHIERARTPTPPRDSSYEGQALSFLYVSVRFGG